MLRFSADASTYTDQKGEEEIRQAHTKGLKSVCSQFFSYQEDYFGRVISVYIRREASELFYGGVVKDYGFFFPLALTTVFPGAFLYEASALKQTSALTLPTPNFQL